MIVRLPEPSAMQSQVWPVPICVDPSNHLNVSEPPSGSLEVAPLRIMCLLAVGVPVNEAVGALFRFRR
jgi:hypothetical protein